MKIVKAPQLNQLYPQIYLSINLILNLGLFKISLCLLIPLFSTQDASWILYVLLELSTPII